MGKFSTISLFLGAAERKSNSTVFLSAFGCVEFTKEAGTPSLTKVDTWSCYENIKFIELLQQTISAVIVSITISNGSAPMRGEITNVTPGFSIAVS